jgi:hypothetical protein
MGRRDRSAVAGLLPISPTIAECVCGVGSISATARDRWGREVGEAEQNAVVAGHPVECAPEGGQIGVRP